MSGVEGTFPDQAAEGGSCKAISDCKARLASNQSNYTSNQGRRILTRSQRIQNIEKTNWAPLHLWQRQNWQQRWVHPDILSCIISRSSLVKMLLFQLEYWRVPCSCTDAFWPPCSQHLMSRLTLTMEIYPVVTSHAVWSNSVSKPTYFSVWTKFIWKLHAVYLQLGWWSK